jgi:hypothetical protein
MKLDLLFLHLRVALAAKNRAVFAGTERNIGVCATAVAGCGKHLAVGAGSILALIAAALASLGLVHEASFSIEFLFTSGEDEFRSTFFTGQSLVCVHFCYLA